LETLQQGAHWCGSTKNRMVGATHAESKIEFTSIKKLALSKLLISLEKRGCPTVKS